MRHALALTLVVMLCPLPAAAQDVHGFPAPVVLTITGFDRGLDGTVTLTLASGMRIVVERGDIDATLTSRLLNERPSAIAAGGIGPVERCKRQSADASQYKTCIDAHLAALATKKARPMTTPTEKAIRDVCENTFVADFVQQNACEEQHLKAAGLGR